MSSAVGSSLLQRLHQLHLRLRPVDGELQDRSERFLPRRGRKLEVHEELQQRGRIRSRAWMGTKPQQLMQFVGKRHVTAPWLQSVEELKTLRGALLAYVSG